MTIELSNLNFPDNAFREYLKQFDINGDNKLASVERNVVKKINVNNKGITTLEGIEHFPKLEKLYCSKNNLTSLDVSKNTELISLFCQKNQLTELDVSKNAKLKRLECSQNSLASLDVRSNAALEYLWCSKNQLTSLNVESTNIDIINNPYSGFDAQNNTYPIAVESNRTFDLSTLPGFDVSKA